MAQKLGVNRCVFCHYLAVWPGQTRGLHRPPLPSQKTNGLSLGESGRSSQEQLGSWEGLCLYCAHSLSQLFGRELVGWRAAEYTSRRCCAVRGWSAGAVGLCADLRAEGPSLICLYCLAWICAGLPREGGRKDGFDRTAAGTVSSEPCAASNLLPLMSRNSSAMTAGPLSMGLPEPLKIRPGRDKGCRKTLVLPACARPPASHNPSESQDLLRPQVLHTRRLGGILDTGLDPG